MATSVRTHECSFGSIPYTLVRRFGYRAVRIAVRGGRISVTTGVCTPLSVISRILTTHDAWLTRAVQSLGVSGVVDPERVRAEYLAHRESARALVTRELERINEHYGFAYGRVSIRNTTSRWGSCSSKKNLNFSYRVLFLPAHLREYVLVHELCHLREMNHGPAFWALVAETIPDYRVRRRAVRGASLALTGATTHTS